MESKSIFLEINGYFSWDFTLNYLASKDEILYKVANNTLIFLYRIENKKYLLKLEYLKEVNKLEVKILLGSGELLTKDRNIISNFIKNWFDLDYDLKKFYDFFENDKEISNIINKSKGLRFVGTPDIYESITWAIIGQQISMSYAYVIKKKFIEKYGDYILYEGDKYWCYPDPKVVSKVFEEDLKELKLSHSRIKYLLNVSQLFATGDLKKEKFNNRSKSESINLLKEIYGIGDWTSGLVTMNSLRNHDVMLKTDAKLLNGLKKIYDLPDKPGILDLVYFEKKWGYFCDYVTFYIWANH
ncbi:DNA-3-methyladenine glycosylase family protein [Companilactobacillus metriopterae]|uniref:DNA-3-methyladenine glycosylase family protein n=1 Tax=Companilactobacillus metriopterae TaxID=1909267 RepID=UPI00100C1238|nr:DNA glycosylase [Companilactobacillus metriopterae]